MRRRTELSTLYTIDVDSGRELKQESVTTLILSSSLFYAPKELFQNLNGVFSENQRPKMKHKITVLFKSLLVSKYYLVYKVGRIYTCLKFIHTKKISIANAIILIHRRDYVTKSTLRQERSIACYQCNSILSFLETGRKTIKKKKYVLLRDCAQRDTGTFLDVRLLLKNKKL